MSKGIPASCEWVPCPTRNNPGKMCKECTGGEDPACVRNYINTYSCVPICNTTAPVIREITTLSPTKATINWTAGTGGSKQKIFIGANKSLVESNCVGNQSPACVVNDQNLTASQTSYTTGNVLSPGTLYYVRVANSKDLCNSYSGTLRFLSSCLFSPPTVTLNIGKTQDLISDVKSGVDLITYVSNNAGVASVSPAEDTSYIYKTTATAISTGTTTVTSNVYTGLRVSIGGKIKLPKPICSANSTVFVIDPQPWWQVKDGDITTTNGDIVSKIPSGYYLDTIGSGGFPGVPVYGGSIGVAPGTISSTLWNANTTTVQGRIFNYSYFENLIPDDTVINDINKLPTGAGVTKDANGYEWYKITGNLDTVGNIDLGSRKVILFIDGNLNINGNINLTDNSGFFVSFVSGNISVAGTAISLEGVYESNGSFTTGVGTSQLLVRGSVASYGGITLQRDLTDDSVTPAEFFEFAPDQVFLFPQKLMYRKTKWAEVAP